VSNVALSFTQNAAIGSLHRCEFGAPNGKNCVSLTSVEDRGVDGGFSTSGPKSLSI